MPTGHCPVHVLPRSAKTSFPGRKDHFATLRGPSRLKPKRSLGRFPPRQRQPFRPCGWSLPGVVAVFCGLASTGRPPCRWRCRWRCSAVCCGRWRCAAGVSPPPLGSPGVCAGCATPPASSARTHEKARAPATGATGPRNPPKKGSTQKESMQSRCRRCLVGAGSGLLLGCGSQS